MIKGTNMYFLKVCESNHKNLYLLIAATVSWQNVTMIKPLLPEYYSLNISR